MKCVCPTFSYAANPESMLLDMTQIQPHINEQDSILKQEGVCDVCVCTC